MPGLFSGLEIGKRALMAQQLAMNTASHNIANSTTPGYSRQRVSLVASYPVDTPQGSVGTGVLADSVRQDPRSVPDRAVSWRQQQSDSVGNDAQDAVADRVVLQRTE